MVDVVEIVVAGENVLGECVLWCDRRQQVFWTDIFGSVLHAHDPVLGTTTRWPMPEPLASFALTAGGDRLLLGLASRLAWFDLCTGTLTPIVDVEPDLTTRINDGRCDRHGNFVFGTFNLAEPRLPIGSFYRFDAASLTLERLPLTPVAISNSICFSPDGTTMYYCDSPSRTIRACAYPSMENDRVFAQVQGGGEPDGSCVDAAGHLWNAQWGGARAVRYAPDGGVTHVIDLPATQPSCVAFGGEHLDRLFCTTARLGIAQPAPADGALLAVGLAGVTGLPESRFGA